MKESYRILGACFEVYKENGCGFLEPVYQECLVVEFDIQSVPFQQQVELVLNYKGRQLVQHYGPDFICFGPSDNYEAERDADEVAAGGATTEDTECTEKVGEDLFVVALGVQRSLLNPITFIPNRNRNASWVKGRDLSVSSVFSVVI